MTLITRRLVTLGALFTICTARANEPAGSNPIMDHASALEQPVHESPAAGDAGPAAGDSPADGLIADEDCPETLAPPAPPADRTLYKRDVFEIVELLHWLAGYHPLNGVLNRVAATAVDRRGVAALAHGFTVVPPRGFFTPFDHSGRAYRRATGVGRAEQRALAAEALTDPFDRVAHARLADRMIANLIAVGAALRTAPGPDHRWTANLGLGDRDRRDVTIQLGARVGDENLRRLAVLLGWLNRPVVRDHVRAFIIDHAPYLTRAFTETSILDDVLKGDQPGPSDWGDPSARQLIRLLIPARELQLKREATNSGESAADRPEVYPGDRFVRPWLAVVLPKR